MTLINLSPKTVHDRLAAHEIVLIDVREPSEFSGERIHGALNFPMSSFDPRALPAEDGKEIVFQCGSGMRSAKAVQACQAAGLAHNAHLQGGIMAWKAAGLPTVTVDPATGRVIDRR